MYSQGLSASPPPLHLPRLARGAAPLVCVAHARVPRATPTPHYNDRDPWPSTTCKDDVFPLPLKRRWKNSHSSTRPASLVQYLTLERGDDRKVQFRTVPRKIGCRCAGGPRGTGPGAGAGRLAHRADRRGRHSARGPWVAGSASSC